MEYRANTIRRRWFDKAAGEKERQDIYFEK